MTDNMNKVMTPEQALKILDDATSQLTLTRKDHSLVIDAVRTIAEAIKPKKDAKEVIL